MKRKLPRNKIVCLFGQTGQGKTWYLQEKIIRPSILPCVIIDTCLEYQDYAILSGMNDLMLNGFYNFKTRIHPKTIEEFDHVCKRILMQEYKHGVNFIIDEVGHYTTEHKVSANFHELIKTSRHHKINVYMSVQNPVEMNKKIRGIATQFVVFKTTEYDYLRYFSKYNPSLLYKLPKLQEKKYEVILK